MRFKHSAIAVLLACAFLLGSCSGGGSAGGGSGTVAFLSPLKVSPDGIFVGETTNVRFTITVQRDSAATITAVNLVKGDAPSETTLAAMTDDGDIANGDSVANDSIYSALVSFSESDTSVMRVKVKVESGAQVTESGPETLAVLTRLTDAEWNTILDTPTQAFAQYATLAGSLTEKAVLLADFVTTLPGVLYAAPSENGVGIWIVYSSGMLGGVILNPAGTKGGKSSSPSKLVTAEGNADAIESKSALYLGPFIWEFDPNDDYDGAWTKVTASRCPTFDTKEVGNFAAADQAVTPDDFKTLSQYGIIIISTHGDTWYNGLFSLWTDLFGDVADTAATLNPFTDDTSQVILVTGFNLTAENRATYENDLQQHRLAIGTGGSVVVTPQYIDHYNGTFPNSIVYLSACRSAFNTSMSDVFLNKGAATVLGYTEYVDTDYSKAIGETTFDTTDGLLKLTPDPTTVEEAYDAAIAAHGAADSSTPPAAYEFEGNTETNLDVAALIDGGFERGDLSSWQFTGEGIIQEALGDVIAPQGIFMGCITTHFATTNALGFIDVEVGGFSSVQQSLCIPEGAETLSFQYNVISEEPLCGPGAPFEQGDSFLVVVSDGDGTLLHTMAERTPTETWIPLGGDYFAGGDHYSTPGECRTEDNSRGDGTFHTDWRTVSLDISSYAGTQIPVTLILSVQDAGDLIYETVMCLDDVSLESGP